MISHPTAIMDSKTASTIASLRALVRLCFEAILSALSLVVVMVIPLLSTGDTRLGAFSDTYRALGSALSIW